MTNSHTPAPVHHSARWRGCVAARGSAQQSERMRRIGVLSLQAADRRCDGDRHAMGVPARPAAGGLGHRPQTAQRAPTAGQLACSRHRFGAPLDQFVQNGKIETCGKVARRTLPECGIQTQIVVDFASRLIVAGSTA